MSPIFSITVLSVKRYLTVFSILLEIPRFFIIWICEQLIDRFGKTTKKRSYLKRLKYSQEKSWEEKLEIFCYGISIIWSSVTSKFTCVSIFISLDFSFKYCHFIEIDYWSVYGSKSLQSNGFDINGLRDEHLNKSIIVVTLYNWYWTSYIYIATKFSVVGLLYFDLRPGQKCHSKVMHRKEVTHSNGSYERKSRGRKLANKMGQAKIPMVHS